MKGHWQTVQNYGQKVQQKNIKAIKTTFYKRSKNIIFYTKQMITGISFKDKRGNHKSLEKWKTSSS